MIPIISAAKIYSTLGNSQSLIPLGIKDVANSMGLTAGSYVVGDKVEGKDRFIDEFGTQAIWLFGIPFFKKLIDKTLFKVAKFNPKVDVRILKDKKILLQAIKFAPSERIKNNIIRVVNKEKTFKGLTLAKFAIATVATIVSYGALTKFRHKHTNEQIEKQIIAEQVQQNKKEILKKHYTKAVSPAFKCVQSSTVKKNPSFTGGIKDFMFDPVKNLMIVDGVITTERFTNSRNPQDFMGYVIKEGAFWGFMYFAGDKIKSVLEAASEKKHKKSIDLDSRVLENNSFKASFANGKIVDSLKSFPKEAPDDVIYKFLYENPDNQVCRMAKKSGIIQTAKATNKIDTQKYINIKHVKGVYEKIEKLYGEYKNSNDTLDKFFSGVRKLKRSAVRKNIGACVGALGVLVPAIMIVTRYAAGNKEFQVKKDIEAKLLMSAKSNVNKI